jgi:hypothetical protein
VASKPFVNGEFSTELSAYGNWFTFAAAILWQQVEDSM